MNTPRQINMDGFRHAIQYSADRLNVWEFRHHLRVANAGDAASYDQTNLTPTMNTWSECPIRERIGLQIANSGLTNNQRRSSYCCLYNAIHIATTFHPAISHFSEEIS